MIFSMGNMSWKVAFVEMVLAGWPIVLIALSPVVFFIASSHSIESPEWMKASIDNLDVGRGKHFTVAGYSPLVSPVSNVVETIALEYNEQTPVVSNLPNYGEKRNLLERLIILMGAVKRNMFHVVDGLRSIQPHYFDITLLSVAGFSLAFYFSFMILHLLPRMRKTLTFGKLVKRAFAPSVLTFATCLLLAMKIRFSSALQAELGKILFENEILGGIAIVFVVFEVEVTIVFILLGIGLSRTMGIITTSMVIPTPPIVPGVEEEADVVEIAALPRRKGKAEKVAEKQEASKTGKQRKQPASRRGRPLKKPKRFVPSA